MLIGGMELLDILWAVAYIAFFLAVTHKFFSWYFGYFLEQGIPGPTPVLVFGNCWKIWTKRWHELELERFRKYGRIYGTFDGRTPNLTIADPKVYRKILVDDFNCFEDRRYAAQSRNLRKLLPSLRGQKWRTGRAAVEPAFSSDSIKGMESIIHQSVQELVKLLEHKVETGTKKIDMQKMSTAYALDVAARVGFGTKLNCMTIPDSTFMQEVYTCFSAEKSIGSAALWIGQLMYPSLMKLLPDSFFNGCDFFVHFANKVLRERKQRAQIENECSDFVDKLLELAKADPKISEEFLVAQILQFIIEGFEPVAAALACGMHALALRDDVQDKLRAEIGKAIVDGDPITSLPYLDQCVNEVLRLYGSGIKLERRCKRSKNYEGAKIRKGVMVSIPIYAIHHDPQIYPSPDEFKPERFSPMEKQKRDPLTFIPFGVGKRNCIASELALTEIKLAMAHLVQEFRFHRVFETADPPHLVTVGYPSVLKPEKVILRIEKSK